MCASSKRSVLVLDDEAELVQLIGLELKRAGFRVYTATDAFNALNLVSKHKPDLILMDFMMPHMNGFQVLEEIKKRGTVVRVIIMSGLESFSDDYIITAVKLGARDFVRKPFSYKDLVARIQRCLIMDAPLPSGDDPVQILEVALQRIDRLECEVDALSTDERRFFIYSALGTCTLIIILLTAFKSAYSVVAAVMVTAIGLVLLTRSKSGSDLKANIAALGVKGAIQLKRLGSHSGKTESAKRKG